MIATVALSAADADGAIVRNLVDVGGVYSVSRFRFGVAVRALVSWWMRSSRAFRAQAWYAQARVEPQGDRALDSVEVSVQSAPHDRPGAHPWSSATARAISAVILGITARPEQVRTGHADTPRGSARSALIQLTDSTSDSPPRCKPRACAPSC